MSELWNLYRAHYLLNAAGGKSHLDGSGQILKAGNKTNDVHRGMCSRERRSALLKKKKRLRISTFTKKKNNIVAAFIHFFNT